MRFMSNEHIDVMNKLLAASPEIRSATARLRNEIMITYELSNGPDGETVYWTTTYAPDGMRLSLGPPRRTPDLMHRADWAGIVRQVRANRAGQREEAKIETIGDMEVFARVADLFELGRQVATVDCEFPDV